jgi:hypothetical protein
LLEFRDVAGGVEICLTHSELETAQAVDMDACWNSTLYLLEEFVDAEAALRSD